MTAAPVRVEFKGWTLSSYASVGLVLLSAGIVIGSVWFLGFALDVWTGAEILVASACLIGAFTTQIQVARRIDIDNSGVTVHAIGQVKHLAWSEFPGFQFPPRLGEVGLAPGASKKGWVGAYFLTLDQARRILAHPACPPVTLSDEVRRGLDLN